jgi:hypothetical protein
MAKNAKTAGKPSCAYCVLQTYGPNFAGGISAGVTGEIFTLIQNGKLNSAGLSAPAFRDAVFLSGVQQIAKDFSKATLKKCSHFNELSSKNPFLFGAATGLPMWVLTRLVGAPLQNSRKPNTAPYAGFVKSVTDEVAYHTVKNGLDEYITVKVLPKVLAGLPNFATQKIVEASVSGVIAGSCYLLSWPVKTALTGQAVGEAVTAGLKMTPKAAIKKLTYTLARPHFVALIP